MLFLFKYIYAQKYASRAKEWHQRRVVASMVYYEDGGVEDGGVDINPPKGHLQVFTKLKKVREPVDAHLAGRNQGQHLTRQKDIYRFLQKT